MSHVQILSSFFIDEETKTQKFKGFSETTSFRKEGAGVGGVREPEPCAQPLCYTVSG